MTRNQILYQQNVETKRANVARETETNRSNVVNERENERSHRAVEAETARHNQAYEQETQRSNLAKELENNRHNVTTETLQYQANTEQARSNRANEALKHEANVVANNSSIRSADAQIKSATIGAQSRQYAADASLYGTQYRSDTDAAIAEENRKSSEKINSEKEFGLQSRQASDQAFQSQQNRLDREATAENTQYTADSRAKAQIVSSVINSVGHVASTFVSLKGGKNNGKTQTNTVLDKLEKAFKGREYQYDEQGRPLWQ